MALQFRILAVINVRILHELQVSNSLTDCDTAPVLQTTTWSLEMPAKLGIVARTRLLQLGVKYNQHFQVLHINHHVCPFCRVWGHVKDNALIING